MAYITISLYKDKPVDIKFLNHHLDTPLRHC